MPTREEEIAASQLARKLKLEKQFEPELTRFFNQMAKSISIVWAATGNIPTLTPFEPELITLLRNHYRRVDRAFNKEVQKEAKRVKLNLETKQIDEIVDSEVQAYIMSHSVIQSGIILTTTQKELQKISGGVLRSSALSDVPLTQSEIGKEIQTRFVDRTGARVKTISITETNTTAEAIKNIESNAFASILANTQQALVNTWNTTLDERTRASHVAADRQEVNHGRPFKVQGQLLKFPGDTSLGATLDNVINCRCSAIASIQGRDAPIAIDPATPLISTAIN